MPPEIQSLFDQTKVNFDKITETIERMTEEKLFSHTADKWSPAQHFQHLIIAIRTSTAAFVLPKFIVRLVGGTSNASRTYDQLVSDYRQKLNNGAKASGRYIPRSIDVSTDKEKLMIRWHQATTLYLQALSKQKNIHSLEKIAVKHPILQKISLVELAYFNIYHTEHHHQLIN